MERSLEIQVLGELAVRVDGEARALPRSRKTRALLGYLAVTGRQHRRDQLCNLFWDVTDDPRAALRWSLSKLRGVLGECAAQCLVASREHIELRLGRGALDLAHLRAAAREGLEAQPTEALEALAEGGRGELLEGLFLPDFDAFEAWLEAERADARRLHSRLFSLLVERHLEQPDRALRHARRWFQRSGEAEAQQWVTRLTSRLDAGAGAALASRLDAASEPPAQPALAAALDPPAPPRPLIGRDAELARLSMIVREARTQHTGRIVLLIGEPGMGKTRLLEELRHRERQPPPCVLAVTFHEAERNRPLAPFLDATRHVLEGAWPAPLDASAPDREQLFETLASLVRRGAQAQGLGLLLIDDAHLGDPSSCELLHYIVRTTARTPLVTVAACRQAELEDNPELVRTLSALRRRHLVEELRLRPLSEAALRELVRGEAPALAHESLLQDSAGNPLVALELARAMPARDTVPRTLAELVLARFAGLAESTRALVRWAAVLERGPLHLLEAACADEVGDFVDALEAATRYNFLRVVTGAFEVAHALLQRVLYEAISPVRRAAMHGALAESLSQAHHDADRSSVIAHHATRADRPELASRALLDGAMGCASIGALREAATLADQALALLERLAPGNALETELRALVVLAQVRRPEEPSAFVARMTELGLAALDHGRTAEAHLAFHVASGLRWEAGAAHEGYGLARQAWHASRGGDSAHRVQASSFMAMCLAMLEKQLPEAHAMVHEAEALARTNRAGVEPAELALARGLLHLHAGRVDDARRDALDARMLARVAKAPLLEASALQVTLQLEFAAGRRSEVAAAAEALRQLSPRIREGGESALADAALALAQPSLEEARDELAAALQWLRELDDKRRLAWVANRWARREREHGHLDAARELATAALAATRAVEAVSEGAIAACELMAAAALAADDEAFVAAEEALAALEATAMLSFEARRLVEAVTAPRRPQDPLPAGVV